MTNTNTQPLSEEWNEVITNICDDLICNTGIEPDGERLGITTTRELVEELEVTLKERLPHLLSEAKREAVEECWKDIKEEITVWSGDTPYTLGTRVGNYFVKKLDQSLKSMSELSNNKTER